MSKGAKVSEADQAAPLRNKFRYTLVTHDIWYEVALDIAAPHQSGPVFSPRNFTSSHRTPDKPLENTRVEIAHSFIPVVGIYEVAMSVAEFRGSIALQHDLERIQILASRPRGHTAGS